MIIVLAEDALGTEEQEDYEHAEGYGILPSSLDLPYAEVFDDAQEKSAKHRAGDAPDPADDRGYNTFEDSVKAHGRLNVRLKGYKDTCHASKRRTDAKGIEDDTF